MLDQHHSVVVGHAGVATVGETLGMVPGITALSEPPAASRDPSSVTVFATDFADSAVPPSMVRKTRRDIMGTFLARSATP